jgi:hypothetical protein
MIVPLEDLMAPAELGGSSLENLLLLQKVMKMRSPLGWAIQPWMDLLGEPLEHQPVVLPLFLLQISSHKGKCQCSSLKEDNKGYTCGWGIGRF